MRLSSIVLGTILLIRLFVPTSFVQSDKLVGRWEGKIQSPQGERDTSLVFKREGDTLTGKMPGLRPGIEILLKDIKIDGNKITAKADVETPAATITINYDFTLEGEVLKGQGALDFGGQNITFDLDLKRVSSATESSTGANASTTNQTGASAGPQRQRVSVPQPQQKQSIDYFADQWSYKYIGRESALGPAPRECIVKFTKRADGKSLEGISDCKYDGGLFRTSSVIVWDEATKMLTFVEKLDNGVTLASKGDWSSAISIRFVVDPVKAKGQSLQLRRTISILSVHSFTVTEELSEDGGPFVRLGNAVYSKAGTK
jgi:hypothetical protein